MAGTAFGAVPALSQQGEFFGFYNMMGKFASVLGPLLAGITANSELSENWGFKGGTCLKKCYFETYRFSEDLDFTVTEEAQLDEQYLLQAFRQMALPALPGHRRRDRSYGSMDGIVGRIWHSVRVPLRCNRRSTRRRNASAGATRAR